jgi:hypothetical protein
MDTAAVEALLQREPDDPHHMHNIDRCVCLCLLVSAAGLYGCILHTDTQTQQQSQRQTQPVAAAARRRQRPHSNSISEQSATRCVSRLTC